MKQKEKSINNSLAKIHSSRSLVKNYKELIHSNDITLRAIEKSYNKILVKAIVVNEVDKLKSLVGAELNNVQIDYLINIIISDYSHYSLPDFDMVAKIMINTKVYHKPSLQSFILALQEHEAMRTESLHYAHEVQEKITSSERDRINKQIYSYYDRLKSMAKKDREIPQEIKDNNAVENNREKIKALKLVYGKELDQVK